MKIKTRKKSFLYYAGCLLGLFGAMLATPGIYIHQFGQDLQRDPVKPPMPRLPSGDDV